MSIETISFPAAIVGYAGLTANMVLVAANRHRPVCMTPVALIVFTHVFLVWHYRYEWEIAQAVRNGYAGFFIFHTALCSILYAPLAGHRNARRLVAFSFLVAAMGASGAVLRYDEVAIYRLPVLICDLTGLCAVALWGHGPAKAYLTMRFSGRNRRVKAEHRRHGQGQ